MIGKFNHAKTRASGLGTLLNSSVYGSAIPTIIGRSRTNLLQIWANNIRQGSSGKKGKKAGKKGAPPNYIENVDFLIGSNPIVMPMQAWGNVSDQYLLAFETILIDHISANLWTYNIDNSNNDFYAVVGADFQFTYSFGINDYGADGSATLSGTMYRPLWNIALAGSDPASVGQFEHWPYVYHWYPFSGPSVVLPGTAGGGMVIRLVVARIVRNKSPLANLRLTFEPHLGSGPEYLPSWTSERIVYPQYAGAGSNSFDLGIGAMPDVRLEVLGGHCTYKDGDADFVDMISETFRAAIPQAGFAGGSAPGYTANQRNLRCINLPGPTQQWQFDTIFSGNGTHMNGVAVNEGDWWLVYVTTILAGSPMAVSDVLGNTYTEVYNAQISGRYQSVFYARMGSSGLNGLILATAVNGTEVNIIQISGVDTLDDVQFAAGLSTPMVVSATSATERGRAGYLVGFNTNPGTLTEPKSAHLFPLINKMWQPGSHNENTGKTTHDTSLDSGVTSGQGIWQGRRITNPGTYTLDNRDMTPGGGGLIVLFAFSNSQPVAYAKPFGDILDRSTLEQVRQQCRAYGLWGSVTMDSQKKAGEWLKEFYMNAIAAPVWAGFKLLSIPYAEASAAGNGGFYQAWTRSGPVADLGPDDMISQSGNGQVVTVDHVVPGTDEPNILQMQHPYRGNSYNDVVTSQPVQALVSLYGPKKQSPQVVRSIQDVAVARKVLSVAARRSGLLRDVYKFKLRAKWKLLLPMALVTVTDPVIGLNKVTVRITSVEEDEKFALSCEAEPWVYGMHVPGDLPVTTPAPYIPPTNTPAASINDPIIFEALAKMNSGVAGIFLWFLLSANDANWGGCQIYASADGSSYSAVMDPFSGLPLVHTGQSNMGLTTGSLPATADPDTTNDLDVDLSESFGELSPFADTYRDNFISDCYLEGGNPDVPYEIIAYGNLTQTGTYAYKLLATGAGNKIRRGGFGSPISTHASSKKFGFLDNVSKCLVDPTWFGKTVYFKFPSFNLFRAGLQSLADCTAYPFFIPFPVSGSVFGEAPSGLIDGSNKTFGLQNAPTPPLSMMLFRNGMVLRQGVDYTLIGSVITFVTAPNSGDWLYAYYRTDGNTASFNDGVTPSGAINGINTAFTLPSAPNPTAFLLLFLNGLLQIAGTDFTLSGATATMAAAPQSTAPSDWLVAWSRVDGVSLDSNSAEIPSGAINSSNTAYTLAATPSPQSTLMLFRNGLLQLPGSDYTLVGAAISMALAPQTGDSLVAFYRK
jgi:hypothetical protein